MNQTELARILPYLPAEVREEILEVSPLREIPAQTEILRRGQYVKVIPLVLEGLIKVFSQYEEKELLLYYIQPRESCVMSFASGLQESPSKVSARTEADSRALLLPADRLKEWIKKYPALNALFFQQYQQRYDDLLDTINQVLFEKMDKRLLDYLREKAHLRQENPLKISHRQIAEDLGSAREVISRVMKKLEHEGKVRQKGQSIQILEG